MSNKNLEKPSDNAWIGKMLLGALCNIALQASQKKLTKENLFATSVVGASAGLVEHLVSKNVTQGKEFSNGLAAGSSAGSMLLLGNSIINGKADFSSGLATIGTLALLNGTIKETTKKKIVELEIPSTINFIATSSNKIPPTVVNVSVKGYWEKVYPNKMFQGRKILTYKEFFVFNDEYYRYNYTLIKLQNDVKFIVTPSSSFEVGHQYFVQFSNEKKWFELPLDYIPANSLYSELCRLANGIGSIIVDKTIKIGKPVLGIIAACATIAAVAASGGTATPILISTFSIISASFSIAANSVELILQLSSKDHSKIIAKIPNGYLNATIGLCLITSRNNQINNELLHGVLTVSENIIGFKITNVSDLFKLRNILAVTNIVVGGEEIIDSL